MKLDRRSMLLGAAATVCLGLSSRGVSGYERPERRVNPVLFWNGVSLELTALDHSVDSADARAPGPCASAMALGAVHAVIADAVHLAYGSDYRPLFYQGRRDFYIEVPELFVGGAAFAILTRIFNTPTHAYTIGVSADKFKKLLAIPEGKDWEAGIAFANSPSFRGLWVWERIQVAILPQFANYVPSPRGHNTDPNNAAQGFYGAAWGSYPPLVLEGDRQVTALEPGAPPHEGSPEYERDLAEIRVKGALRSRPSRYFPARTPHETNIGLFWAYDGARRLGTPPRLYNQILRQIAIQDQFDLFEMARMFALCNIAMADASIVCWRAKYRYNVWRPVIGIQNHRLDPDPDWLPFGAPKTNRLREGQGAGTAARGTAQSLMGGGVPFAPAQPIGAFDVQRQGRWGRRRQVYGDTAFTPNFPSYPSGHATFGGACFTMLKLIRRERRQTRHDPGRIQAEFVSDELNGVSADHVTGRARPYYPLVYNTLDDMIADNELSRIYLGVHWRFDCNRGSESGARVAEAVYRAAYLPYQGSGRYPS
jgi:membrane-associated phospholipid phosphatase